MNRFMDTLTAMDAAHRLAAQTSSDNLLQAIRAARAGTCVVTPTKPLKLPPDAKERIEKPRAPRQFSTKGVSLLPLDRVKHLMRAGANPQEIAEIMRIGIDRVNYWIARAESEAQ